MHSLPHAFQVHDVIHDDDAGKFRSWCTAVLRCMRFDQLLELEQIGFAYSLERGIIPVYEKVRKEKLRRYT